MSGSNRNGMDTSAVETAADSANIVPDFKVIIMGAGFGGIGLGAKLRDSGELSFLILEKSSEIGGVWRDNTYPGSGCDIPSHLYSYSFEPNPEWPEMYSDQSSILSYINDVADRRHIRDHIRFQKEVVAATWQEHASCWLIETADGDAITARVFVSACGQLNRPHIPELPGAGSFEGAMFHTSNWRHDVDLKGKKVAVLGNGASAVQFVPAIAPDVEKLVLFQRSPGWVVPKANRAYSEEEKQSYRARPDLYLADRRQIFAQFESFYPIFSGEDSNAAQPFIEASLAMLESQIDDPELRKALTPDYPIGCKRLLFTNDFYPALNRSNVEVVTQGVSEIKPDGVISSSGTFHPVDVIVYATGFLSHSFTGPTKITGREGANLQEFWGDSPRAYLGMTVPSFPNMFILYGPNTTAASNSLIFMLECQYDYVVQAIRALGHQGRAAVDIKAERFEHFDQEQQAALRRTPWASMCTSWFKNADGRVISNWHASGSDYAAATRIFDLDEYNVTDFNDESVDPPALFLPDGEWLRV